MKKSNYWEKKVRVEKLIFWSVYKQLKLILGAYFTKHFQGGYKQSNTPYKLSKTPNKSYYSEIKVNKNQQKSILVHDWYTIVV